VLRAHGYEPSGSGGLSDQSRARLSAIELHFHDLRREAGCRCWKRAGRFIMFKRCLATRTCRKPRRISTRTRWGYRSRCGASTPPVPARSSRLQGRITWRKPSRSRGVGTIGGLTCEWSRRRAEGRCRAAHSLALDDKAKAMDIATSIRGGRVSDHAQLQALFEELDRLHRDGAPWLLKNQTVILARLNGSTRYSPITTRRFSSLMLERVSASLPFTFVTRQASRCSSAAACSH